MSVDRPTGIHCSRGSRSTTYTRRSGVRGPSNWHSLQYGEQVYDLHQAEWSPWTVQLAFTAVGGAGLRLTPGGVVSVDRPTGIHCSRGSRSTTYTRRSGVRGQSNWHSLQYGEQVYDLHQAEWSPWTVQLAFTAVGGAGLRLTPGGVVSVDRPTGIHCSRGSRSTTYTRRSGVRGPSNWHSLQ